MPLEASSLLWPISITISYEPLISLRFVNLYLSRGLRLLFMDSYPLIPSLLTPYGVSGFSLSSDPSIFRTVAHVA